jgi:Flp pilus assembly protein TadD
VEWERAAWTHAGDPRGEATAKLRLLRWRLCSVLAALSDELAHYRRAVRLRDDLWTGHLALGRALLRAGCAPEAAQHLRRASEMSPFDTSIDPDLLAALDAAGDHAGRRDFVAERELLTRAAPFDSCPEIRFAQEVVR